jgi:hypothetical protein
MPFQLMGSDFTVLVIQHDLSRGKLENSEEISATKETSSIVSIPLELALSETKRVANLRLRRLFIGLHVLHPRSSPSSECL